MCTFASQTSDVPGATEDKKRILYECWSYKKGGGHFSTAYKKRYFVITVEHRLHYYEGVEHYYQNREKGWLSCLGMLVNKREGMETIEGKECFTFTIQAKEGTRTSEIKCACETNEQRERLLATIGNIEKLVAGKIAAENSENSATVKAHADPKVVENLVIEDKPREVPLVVKKKYGGEDKAGAQIGIVCTQHPKGLLVAGFKAGSDASTSELRVGDVIVQAEESFLAGLSASEAFELMNGRMLTPVELTVSRQAKGVTNRVLIETIRDVPAPPTKALVGFDFKVEALGVRVVKVHGKTSAFDELQKDDVITEVNDELIIGDPLLVVQELLAGPVGAEVVLGFSRFDKKKSFIQRCSAVVLFDYKPRPVDTTEYALNNDSSWGEPGVMCADDPLGLKVTGVVTGSSAASSGLQIGDVIIEVGDELLLGLSSVLAFEKMKGDRDTEFALTAIRKNPTTGGKERISTYVLRDVGKGRCQKARPGFESVLEPSGLRVTNIVHGSSVVETDLKLGDIITSINEDFISGMTIEETWPLLWGEMTSSVELMITRLVSDVKSRMTIDVVRDHNPSSEVPRPPKSNCSTAMLTTKKITQWVPLNSSAPRKSVPVVPTAPSKGTSHSGNLTKLVLFLIMILAIYIFSGTGGTGPTTFRVLDSKGDAIGEVMLSFETAAVREGADSSDFRVHVYKIDGFPHSVRDGWGGQDTTDPYILLQVGDATYRTRPKKNGGGNVTFDERITFKKLLSNTILKFKVFDKNMVSDSLFGEFSVDLRQQTIKTVDEITW